MIWTHIALSSNFQQSFSNSWIQLLFYFFLYHRLKTLNKEEYNLTHLVLVVILQVFMKNTHGLAYVAFSNISSRLWLGDNTIWRILSIKEIYQLFIQTYNLLLIQRLLKNFNHGQYGLNHVVLSKKNDQTAFELRCTSQNVYVKLYVLNHIVLSSILYKFPRKALFSIFIKSCIFFSIYTILNELNQGQYGLTHIVLFKKMINFCQKHIWFELRCIFQHI